MIQPELIYFEETHQYFADTIELPSVTMILNRFFPMSDFIPENVMEKARQRGKFIHSACEYLDLGTLDIQSLDPHTERALNCYKAAKIEHNIKIQLIEERIYHPILWYAGCIDRLAIVDDILAVVDIKTGSAIYDKDFYQLAAYCGLLKHLGFKVRDRYILHLREKLPNGYNLIKAKDKNDFVIWQSALNVYTAQEK